MTIAELTTEIIKYSDGNLHDIEHLLKVYAYAKTIGESEGIPAEEQFTLEVAALLHDIACPLCREKYGNTNGKHQEEEGAVLTEEFLRDKGLPQQMVDRVVFLVSHHHTIAGVDGADYQILLEADYLVNASESNYSKDNIRNTLSKMYKTKTGSSILRAIYGV